MKGGNMQKRLLIWLLPFLFGSVLVDSTEIPFELSAKEEYELTKTVYGQDFQSLPQNPNVFKEEKTYLDAELTTVASSIQPNQAINITGVAVNSKKELVFQLDGGSYILASTAIIFDDTVSSEQMVGEYYWLKKGAELVSSPISNQSAILSTTLQPYQPVLVTKIATTALGEFAYIEEQGWISLRDLSEQDNRMEAVEELLVTKYSKENIGVFVKQLSTGFTAGVNQEKSFYSASIAKLPILYYTQEKLFSGEVALTSKFTYTMESMQFLGAYNVSGSGSLPKVADNKEYSLEELINKTAKESDNVASNLLSYYLTNRFDTAFYNLITEQIGNKWDMVTRETSPQTAGLMMEALYQQDGYVLESLLSTQFDNQRISKDISVPVAHKIGDADDVKHDVAIVYADSPFVLSIFTDKSNYDEISQIANDVYGILK